MAGGSPQTIGSQVKVVVAATLSQLGDVVFSGGAGRVGGIQAAAQFNNEADRLGITIPPPGILVVQSPAGSLSAYHVVVRKGLVSQVNAAAAANPAGGAGGSGFQGGPQGATNALQRTATGGGADIPRAKTSIQGVAMDVRTEFVGINSYAPDNQISPQEAAYAENVDSISTRGALGKRPGTITTYPQRGDVVNSVSAITSTLKGRSINALPAGFREDGKVCLVLGYDGSSILGEGTTESNTKECRAVPVDPLWHPERDIRRVKPSLTINDFDAAGIDFDLVVPTPFKKDGAGTRLQSVDYITVIASDLGFQLDPDNEDALEGDYLAEKQAWDGTSLKFVDTGGTVAVVRYYSVFLFSKQYRSDPLLFKVTPT